MSDWDAGPIPQRATNQNNQLNAPPFPSLDSSRPVEHCITLYTARNLVESQRNAGDTTLGVVATGRDTTPRHDENPDEPAQDRGESNQTGLERTLQERRQVRAAHRGIGRDTTAGTDEEESRRRPLPNERELGIERKIARRCGDTTHVRYLSESGGAFITTLSWYHYHTIPTTRVRGIGWDGLILIPLVSSGGVPV